MNKYFIDDGISDDSINQMLVCFDPKIKNYKHNDTILRYSDDKIAVGLILSGNNRRRWLRSHVHRLRSHNNPMRKSMSSPHKVNKQSLYDGSRKSSVALSSLKYNKTADYPKKTHSIFKICKKCVGSKPFYHTYVTFFPCPVSMHWQKCYDQRNKIHER